MSTTTTTQARNRTTLLNQLVAIEKSVKARAKDAQTTIHQQMQRGSLEAALTGLIRTYRPIDDEGVRLPDERTRVQVHVDELLDEAARTLSRLFDVTASKDETNARARGDIVVDGETIAAQVPVTFLMTLEKELIDWRGVVAKLPVLDIADVWTRDADAGAYRSDPRETTRTAKVPRVQVLYEATEKHPAQVTSYNEDVVVGFWTTVKLSGAIPAGRKATLLDRVDKLIAAVRMAREQANMEEVVDNPLGAALTGYLLRD
ncbi:hypothetical protein [Cryptosporangium aurantiacum]|uniref:Uncharacterized protein n=1 Tax=Cryptosporangium aurantiacum TaxID=134849 RepID=A0A1M7QFF4_9ACTN|nr:hypothetical protein [Cryptosporangium aurantiacum]SHN29756.1 hypothetical protein SAMN05443668_104608 [Cryptosporangium aurantiacum]